MPTIAEQNRQNTDLMYQLLQEGKLDLMYLPSGVIAWLWDRPLPQMEAARDLAVAAKDVCPVTDGAVLRSDQNILILKCEDGHKFNVYPDGGYGCDGQPMDIHGCMELLDQGMMNPMPEEDCPMEGGGAPEPGVEFMTYDRLADEASAAMVDELPSSIGEAREISLKELTYDELRNWFRKMRAQLSPPQVKGIKRLLIQKRMDELGGDGGFSDQIRQWQPVGEAEDKRDISHPDFVNFGAKDIAANPEAAFKIVKDLMQKSLARLQPSGSDEEMAWGNIPPDPEKAHWPEKIQKLWLQFSKAMHDEDWSQAARVFQDYFMMGKEGDADFLMADVGGEGEDSFQRDREDEMVDVICKTRSARQMPDFMKQMGEAQEMMPGSTGRDFDEEDILDQIGYAARQARGVGEKAEVVLELLRTSPRSVVNNWKRAGSPYPNTPQFMEYLKNYIGISDEDIARLEKEDRAYKARMRGQREDVGDRGGTPIGTDVFDFEDELAQIATMVGEELKKHQD